MHIIVSGFLKLCEKLYWLFPGADLRTGLRRSRDVAPDMYVQDLTAQDILSCLAIAPARAARRLAPRQPLI